MTGRARQFGDAAKKPLLRNDGSGCFQTRTTVCKGLVVAAKGTAPVLRLAFLLEMTMKYAG